MASILTPQKGGSNCFICVSLAHNLTYGLLRHFYLALTEHVLNSLKWFIIWLLLG